MQIKLQPHQSRYKIVRNETNVIRAPLATLRTVYDAGRFFCGKAH